MQSGKNDIWVWDIASGNSSRMTFNSSYNRTPVWSPDGSHIAYVANQSGTGMIFVKPAGGMGQEVLWVNFEEISTPLNVVTNWDAESKKK